MKLGGQTGGRYRWVLISTLVIQALGLVPYGLFAVIQGRVFGAEGRGEVALVVNLVFLAVAIADLGYTIALPYQTAQSGVRPEVLLGNFLLWTACFLPIVFLGMFVLAASSDTFGLSVYFGRHAGSIALLLITTQLTNYIQFEALGAEDFTTYNVLLALSQTVMPVAFAAIYLLQSGRPSLDLAVLCYSIGNLVEIPAVVILTRGKSWRVLRRARVSLVSLRSHLGTGLKGFVSVICGQLFLRVDVFIIFFILHNANDVGVYSMAILLLSLWGQVPAWMALTLWPKSAHNDPDVVGLTIKLAWGTIITSAVGALIYLALAPTLPNLFAAVLGSGFHAVYVILLLMLPRAILAGPGALLAGNLAGKGYALYHPLSAVVALVASVPLNIILVPRYRLMGAGVTVSTSYVLQLAILLYGFCRVNGLSLQDLMHESRVFWTDLSRVMYGGYRSLRARLQPTANRY